MVGHCSFVHPMHPCCLVLPQIVHVRGVERLATLVQFVRDESREQRPARSRAVTTAGSAAHRGAAVHGGNDCVAGAWFAGCPIAGLAAAIRVMHEHPTRAWTVAELAKVPHCRAQPFLNVSTARSAWRPWNICSPGAWRSPRTCYAVMKPRLRRCTARWLQLRQHLQRCVHAARRATPSQYARGGAGGHRRPVAIGNTLFPMALLSQGTRGARQLTNECCLSEAAI